MGEMRLTVRHVGPLSQLECTTPQGATITFDDPDEGTFGGSPVQHLLSAIGACALVDVAAILRKKRLEFRNLRVDLHGARVDEHPRRFTDVKMTFLVEGDVPAKALDDAARLAVEKYCSVAATVMNGATVSFQTKVG